MTELQTHNIGLCHGCPLMTIVDHQGTCGVDRAGIVEHARRNTCPHPAGSRYEGRPVAPGLGDWVESIGKLVGADKAARLYERWSGTSCRCSARKAWLNRAWAAAKRRMTV